ncbi:unnamed protein product [Caenorhabditis angaria]|uniref:Signal recognition particle subunit SRP72 n=1 Tax=Caenorhabditis angaria TaxID=860376 RepID=A0A9P1N063_9PELO|nr:unnamed protein product [Caenorhabditis angaria]
MTETSAGGLYQCITDIARADTSGDYQKALQAANKLIRKFPKETFAFKCKLVALIQLSSWEEALTIIKKTPTHQMGNVSFEKAYIFYRQGDLDQALKELENCEKDDIRALELKAQIYYKQENFTEAYEIFRFLLKNHSDDSDELRRANYLAVQARLEAQGSKQQLDTEAEDSYSQLYNRACVEIEAEKLPQALASLDKALVICRQTLTDEDREEDEIEEELDSIRVQRAYVLQRMGKRDEALEIYKKVQAANHSDESVKATITNNIPAASSDFGMSESRKKFKAALQIDQSKLTRRQRRTLMLNNALVLLLSNQREPCKRALEELVSKFGTSKDVALIEAALYVKLNDTENALRVLAGDDQEQQFARLHVLLNAGKLPEASAILNNFKNRPLGVSSLLTSILIASDKKADAAKELTNSLSKAGNSEEKKSILEGAVDLETANGNIEQATKHLEKLAEMFSDDLTIQCRLVGLYSKVDPKKAEQLSNKIFPENMEVDINVDELEESDWILYGEKYRQKKEAKGEAAADDNEIITRKLKNQRRKRKIRLPKNYNPDVLPDPERWLPRQERSTYKKKRKNREREIGRGTQGSSSANPNVEYMAASPNSPRPLPGPAAEGPRQQRPNFQKQKKKKSSKF